MKTIFLLPILLLSLISTPCLSETMGDLVKRDGIYYKKLTETPFTGKVTGRFQGRLENGKKEGEWVKYHDTKIFSKGSYKNGKREGDWVGYHDNGNVSYRGSYKNGKKEGEWVSD
jgi:antitoxin component YwqK of YwqJK toxin-antitoxin module